MRLDNARARLSSVLGGCMDNAAARLNEARMKHRAHHPAKVLERRMEYISHVKLRLVRAGADIIDQRMERLGRLSGLLRALGPESAFQRGFSITLGADGKVLRSAASLKPGDLLRTKFADGDAASRVVDG
jgi:exodeoxyribonuclease VII large subunit